MAGTEFNTIQSLNGGSYGTPFDQGFQKSVQTVRKFDNILMAMLNAGTAGAHRKYLTHKSMPTNLGDTINVRRYFSLETDPSKLKLDKNTITGPELKKVKGASVEAKLEWYGNGIELNDTLKVTHLDPLMAIYLPVLHDNAQIVMDNIAALALYDGASKAFIKAYDATKVSSVTLGTNATDAEAAGALNLDVFSMISAKMLNNKETYTVQDASGADVTVTVPARIKPFANGRYKVLVSASGMDDLLRDEKFKKDFIYGIQSKELAANRITELYRFSVEEIDNHLTIAAATAAADAKPVVDWSGSKEVAFIFGQEFGFDVTMSGQGVKVFTKTDAQVDTGDKYGRLNFITYKFAYVAKVSNSAAITAVVYTPLALSAAGSVVAPTTVAPQQ